MAKTTVMNSGSGEATGGSRDAYKKDSSPRGLNHRDKGSPAKSISTAKLKKFDKQC